MINLQLIENEQLLECTQHKKPYQVICLTQRSFLCQDCLIKATSIGQYMQIKSVSEIIILKRTKCISQIFEYLENCLRQVEIFYEELANLKQTVCSQLDILMANTQKFKENLENNLNKTLKYSFYDQLEILIQNNWDKQQIDTMNNLKVLKNNNKIFCEKILHNLEQFKMFQDFQTCQEKLLIAYKLNEVQEDSKSEVSQLKESTEKEFSYQILTQFQQKQLQICYAIAINSDNSLVAISSDFSIRIFELENGFFQTELQVLEGFSSNVNILKFFQQYKYKFISCSNENNLIIWERTQQQKWILYQQLQGHHQQILCLITHPIRMDLIITGSLDTQIKFWSQNLEQNYLNQIWRCIQTIQQHQKLVSGLSVNDSGQQIISCGEDNFILVMQSIDFIQWSVQQRILIDQQGFHLCFMSNEAFFFSPLPGQQLFIYNQNLSKQYQLNKQVVDFDYNGYFLNPLFYSNNNKLLFYQNENQVCILKPRKTIQFSQIQDQIKMQDCFKSEKINDLGYNQFCCTLSNDGQFLMSWNDKYKNLEVRKLILY